MANRPVLSVVSPVFQAAEILDELVRRVTAAATTATADFELILVDDGSSDGSWDKIAAAARHEPRLRGVRLLRNFGQAQAIRAGLDQAKGDYIVVMDCDLQDNPAYIPALLAKAREGFDIVMTRRRRRQGLFRRVMSGIFFYLYNLLADNPTQDRGVGGYSLITRDTAAMVRQAWDVNANYLAAVGWIGGRRALLAVEAAPRFAGRSSYTTGRLFRVGVSVLCRSSNRLLALALVVGVIYLVAAGGAVVYLFARSTGVFTGSLPLVALVLVSTGIILLTVGILGLYLGDVFDQVRGRPFYLVRAKVNCP